RSWAVPKGPSRDPSQKRLAVHVEDHPVDYGTFEGTIPKGEYGGGTVMLWDRGTYTCDTDPVKEYKDGMLKITFQGDRMQGKWARIKMKKKGHEEEDNWLLIKEKDDHTIEEGDEDITDEFIISVKTERTMNEIAESKEKSNPKIDINGKSTAPKFIKPQL